VGDGDVSGATAATAATGDDTVAPLNELATFTLTCDASTRAPWRHVGYSTSTDDVAMTPLSVSTKAMESLLLNLVKNDATSQTSLDVFISSTCPRIHAPAPVIVDISGDEN
jgi:hypothetical protein